MSIKTIASTTPAGRPLSAIEIAAKARKALAKATTGVSAEDQFMLDEEAGSANEVTRDERQDKALTEEQKAVKASKQREEFNNALIEVRKEHVPAYDASYTGRTGLEHFLEIEDCDADLYILAGQPNAPQLTATATETRSSGAALSDEA